MQDEKGYVYRPTPNRVSHTIFRQLIFPLRSIYNNIEQKENTMKIKKKNNHKHNGYDRVIYNEIN